MWNWFNCYLSGRHEYGVWCEPGAIFLRCVHCGKRSPGWAVDAKPTAPHTHTHAHPHAATPAMVAPQPAPRRRVVPFERSAAR